MINLPEKYVAHCDGMLCNDGKRGRQNCPQVNRYTGISLKADKQVICGTWYINC